MTAHLHFCKHINNKPKSAFKFIRFRKSGSISIYCQQSTLSNRNVNNNKINVLRLAYGRRAALINLTTVIKSEKRNEFHIFSQTFASRSFSFTCVYRSFIWEVCKCTLIIIFIASFEFRRQKSDVKQLKYTSITVCTCRCMWVCVSVDITCSMHASSRFFEIRFKRTAMECNAVLFLTTPCMCACVNMWFCVCLLNHSIAVCTECENWFEQHVYT